MSGYAALHVASVWHFVCTFFDLVARNVLKTCSMVRKPFLTGLTIRLSY
jgi:hypothetical protein